MPDSKQVRAGREYVRVAFDDPSGAERGIETLLKTVHPQSAQRRGRRTFDPEHLRTGDARIGHLLKQF